MQMGYLVNDWKYSGNLQPKSGMGEKQLLQNPGYVRVVGEMHTACLQDIHCCCRGCRRGFELHSVL